LGKFGEVFKCCHGLSLPLFCCFMPQGKGCHIPYCQGHYPRKYDIKKYVHPIHKIGVLIYG
ncbi:MAG: hypothetical protein AAGH42_08475, partial [Pseudomonadota bacterium]